MRVSANFFHMLGVRPAIGRDFRADEDTPNGWRVVILSDGLWRRRFNGDPSVDRARHHDERSASSPSSA